MYIVWNIPHKAWGTRDDLNPDAPEHFFLLILHDTI